MEITTKALATPYILTVIEKDTKKIFKRCDELWEEKKNSLEGEGFEEGSEVPRSYAEKKIGINILYKEAFNELLQQGLKECDRQVVDVVNWCIDLFDKKNPVIVSAQVFFEPKVQKASYKNIAVEVDEVKMKESEVDATLERIRSNNASYPEVEGEVQNGYIVTVNFNGTIGGKTYKGGEVKNFVIEVGSGNLIHGFEEELVGHKVGDKWKFTKKMPEDFLRKDLAGQEIEYEIEILRIRERILPDLNDSFAKNQGYDNLEDMRQQIQQDIKFEKEKIQKQLIQSEVLKKAVATMKIDPIPDIMIEQEIESMLQEMLQNVRLTKEEYFKRAGVTEQDYRNSHWFSAVMYVKSRLLLQHVIKKEKIEATDEEREDFLKEKALKEGVSIDELREKANMSTVDLVIKKSKATELIMDAAQVTKKNSKKRLAEYKKLIPQQNLDKASTVLGRDEDKKIIKKGE